MALDFGNYDPSKIVFSFGEILITGGWMDGTFVDAERSDDGFKMKVGAGGDVLRVKNANRTGAVTITLLQSASANDDLSALALEDELEGLGYRALQIKDLNGRTLCTAPQAWIRKLPKVEFADDATGREWVFDCAELNIFAGSTAV